MKLMPAVYSMKSVMRLTGLSADRLRIWERRYKAVLPGRTITGRRSYGETEVKRLKLLADLVRQGHSIGLLAGQSDRDLALLLARGAPGMAPELRRQDFEGLLEAVDRYDIDGLKRGIARARHTLSPHSFAFLLVPQLMTQLGARIEAGELTIAQEHNVSDLLRHVLRQQYDDLQPLEGQARGAIVLAAPEDHLHDFGVLLAAILCRFHGFRTHFLGPNLPAEALASAAQGFGASVVVLGISSLPPGSGAKGTNEYLAELDRHLRKKASLWLGGPGSGEVKRRKLGRDVFVFDNLEELGQKLEGSRGQL